MNSSANGTPVFTAPTFAMFRVYAIRKATIAGTEKDVLGEQIGGDHGSRKDAEAAGQASGLRYQVKQVGGIES